MKTTTYEAHGIEQRIEEDDYENGVLDAVYTSPLEVEFSASTIEDLLKEIMDFFGVERKNITSDSENPGVIEITYQTTNDGDEPSDSQIEAWKKGEYQLSLTTSVLQVKIVTREPVSIV